MSPVTNLIYQALREEPPLTGFRRSSPLRGASILPYDCGGSPGGELDAKRPEGWFLAANLKQSNPTPWNSHCARRHLALPQIPSRPIGQGLGTVKTVPYRTNYNGQHALKQSVGRGTPPRRKLGQHRTIPALRLKHRSGSCGTASALPKCSIRHPVLSALLAWHLPHLARRIGT